MMVPVSRKPVTHATQCGAVLLAVLLSVVLVGACGSRTTGGGSAAPAAAASEPAGAETPYEGACPSGENSRPLAKTRFALHAGLGLGAFHRYIYKPAREGKFRANADNRGRTLAKAAVAGLFTAHELKVAKGFAVANPTLCNAIQSITNNFTGLVDKLKNGSATEADVDASQSSFDALRQQATQDGFGFNEKNVTVPGAD
ncbi:hypothetical protein [Candidatus Protofrankia datiscae]|uniref:Lipoprotein n=1 Tax=Candidatus Protofrankia datiscae TaxID=2716812 RepID=F8AWK5_9ACTN|nr:hypothetical protein [Candidatus Protofrankia datiscae]AEH09342.1 hypothetical protein FsymDg_1905 [Candidatus Protofrankia datiscae]